MFAQFITPENLTILAAAAVGGVVNGLRTGSKGGAAVGAAIGGVGAYAYYRAAAAGGILNLIASPASAGVPGMAAGTSGSVRRVIQRVSAHEGKPYSINANTDGAGNSYGIIQWTQRSGNLYGLLAFMQKKHPAEFEKYFGPRWRDLLDHAKGAGDAMRSGISDGTSSGRLWEEPWLSRFKAAGQDPLLAEAQWDYAENHDQHILGAEYAASKLGVRSERALALFYDRTVQQGTGANRQIVAAVLQKWGGSRPDYQQTLKDYAAAAADRYRSPTKKGPEWKQVGDEYHKVTVGKDRWKSTWKRAQAILDDTSLSDSPLPARTTPVPLS